MWGERYRLAFAGLFLWVAAGVEAATQVPIAPMVGPWQHSGTRCEAAVSFPSEAAVIAGALARYGACGDASVEALGPWGTPEKQTYGACGSSKRYPTFRMGVETQNTRALRIRYCRTLTDGYTHYRQRSVGCPSGFASDGARCVPSGVNTLKNLGPCDATRPAAGNPVTISSGNNYLSVEDFLAPAGVPAFSRYYNSGDRAADVGLGRGWRHSWTYRVRWSANSAISSVQLHRPSGQVWFFTKASDGTWQADSDIGARLSAPTPEAQQQDPSLALVLETAEGTREWYDDAGYIRLLREADGLPYRFFYDVDGDPATLDAVEGAFGHRLKFEYTADHRIDRIITPRGDAIEYTYAATGLSPTTLSGVRYPDALGNAVNDGFDYAYEDATLPGALTAVRTRSGESLSQWAYDSAGRAILSVHGDSGLDETRFAFGSGETTVTRVLDSHTASTATYRFETLAGVPKLVSVEGDVCRDCAATGVRRYDDLGHPAYIEDASGHVTLLAHDARGRLTCRLEGVPNPAWPADARLAASAMRLTLWQYDGAVATPARESLLSPVDPLIVPESCPADADADGLPDSHATAWIRYRQITRQFVGEQVIETHMQDDRSDVPDTRSTQRQWLERRTAWGDLYPRLAVFDGPRNDVDDRTQYFYHPDSSAYAGQLERLVRTVDVPGRALYDLTTTFLEYDGNGRPALIRREDQTTLTLFWDERGRLRERHVDGLVQRFAYDVQSRLIEVTEAPLADPEGDLSVATDGRAMRLTRDAAGRVMQRQVYRLKADGSRIPLKHETLERNLAGWVTRVALLADGDSGNVGDASGAAPVRETALTYEALGQHVAITHGRIFTEHREYDSAGRLTDWRDPRASDLPSRGPGARLMRDALGQLAGVTFLEGDVSLGEVRFERDALGLPSMVHVKDGASTAFAADGFGDLAKTEDGDAGRQAFVRDAAGAVVAMTANGTAQTTVTRDSLGRPVEILFPNPEENLRLYWDQGADCGFGAGRLCRVEDALGEVSYRYDARGNRVAERRVIDGAAHDFSYTFDPVNRLVRLRGPDGTERHYGYDELGRVVTVTTDARIAEGASPIFTGVLNAAGDLLVARFGNGAERRFTLNALGQRLSATLALPQPPNPPEQPPSLEVPLPTALIAVLAAMVAALGCRRRTRTAPMPLVLVVGTMTVCLASLSGIAVQGLSLLSQQTQFDAAGNLVAWDDAQFVYDGRSRLVSVNSGDTLQTFHWDDNGNRGLAGDASPERMPGSNRLLSSMGEQYRWDDAGRMTGMGPWTFAWNARGQLAEVSRSGTTVARYRYDYRGRRLWALVNGRVEVRHIDDAGRLLAISEAGQLTTRWFWRGGQPLAQHSVADDAWTYLLTDANGTPRVGLNEAGETVWRWSADGFGETSPERDPDGDGQSVQMRLRFPGQFEEPVTGLFYNHFRDYVPVLGRYLSPDPVGLAGGLNPYLYAEGNPLVRSDPFGLTSYRCHAPLNPVHAALEQGLGFPLRRLRFGPDLAVRHEYLCVVDTAGEVSCGGQAPAKTGNPIFAPGAPTNDVFVERDCSEIRADDVCFEQCLTRNFAAPRPQYSLFNVGGENCQAWSTRLEAECSANCRKDMK